MIMSTRVPLVLVLLLSLPCVVAAQPAPETYTHAASAGSQASVTTPGITTTSGNLLVVVVSAFSNIIGATPITDSKTNTWIQAVASTGASEGWGAIYYAENITGGAGHTVTFTPSSSGFIAIAVLEVSGLATSSALNQTDADASSATTHSTGPITASGGICEMAIAGGTTSDNGAVPMNLIAVPWSTRVLNAGGSSQGVVLAWQVIASGASVSFQFNTPSSDSDTAMLAGFKAASPCPGAGAERAVIFVGE